MKSGGRTINFMGWRKFTAALSVVLIAVSLTSLSTKGLQFSMEFTGGTLIEVSYDRPVQPAAVRDSLEKSGYQKAVVTHFGTNKDILIRLPQSRAENPGNQVFAALQRDYDGTATLRRMEYVGPQVGEDLREQAALAVFIVLIALLVYVGARFQYKFAVGAVASLIHDVIVVLGAFSVAGWEFDLTVLAAVLTVIGYSLNDTIVVYDRIRENFRKIRQELPEQLISLSINQTMSRTLMTSLTTLLVVVALFFLGGEAVHGFATALLIGIAFGTYSSIYVAASVLLALKIDRQDLMTLEHQRNALEKRP